MNKMPTAEEFLLKHYTKSGMTRGDQATAMIEFAKLHVQAALNNAVNCVDFDFKKYPSMDTHGVEICEDSILGAYPLTLIE